MLVELIEKKKKWEQKIVGEKIEERRIQAFSLSETFTTESDTEWKFFIQLLWSKMIFFFYL